MLAKLVSSGNGARGAVDYVTHDPATPAMSRPTTAERVAWTSTSPALAAVGVDDPEEAPAAMRALIASAPELKRAAGVSARGRRLKKPFTHLVLSLPPGQHLDRAQWMDAAAGALDTCGWGACQYVSALHTDKGHEHLHVIVCRVDPANGRAIEAKRAEILALSQWAENWERNHGGIQIEARAERNAARLDREIIADGLTAAGQERWEADREARRCVPLPPTENRCRRPGPGRPEHSDKDRREWAAIYQRHASADVDVRAQRRERCALARRQRRRRAVRQWLPFGRQRQAPPRDRQAIMRIQARRAEPHLDLARARIGMAAERSLGTDGRLDRGARAIERRMRHAHAILEAALAAADTRIRPAPRPAAGARAAAEPVRPARPQPPRRPPAPTWRQQVQAARPAPEPPHAPEPAAGAAEAADRDRDRGHGLQH